MAEKDYEVKIEDKVFTIKLDETYGASTSYLDNTENIIYTTDSYIEPDTITLDMSDIKVDLSDTTGQYNFNWAFEQKEFENCLPSIDDVKKMCEVYPGLEKAFENFKTAYKLVEQDYKGKKKAGELDDDIPF